MDCFLIINESNIVPQTLLASGNLSCSKVVLLMPKTGTGKETTVKM
jgi:hypothetical protein